MVQATQAASNSLLAMITHQAQSNRQAGSSVFSLGKAKDASQAKPRASKQDDPLTALVACALMQGEPAKVDDANAGSGEAKAGAEDTTGLASNVERVVDNLEGMQNISREMLVGLLLEHIGAAQAGDEDAQAWLQALLARMPEDTEWNSETLAQFLNENVDSVQSAPYPLETIYNTAAQAVMQETAVIAPEALETEEAAPQAVIPSETDETQTAKRAESDPKPKSEPVPAPAPKSETTKAQAPKSEAKDVRAYHAPVQQAAAEPPAAEQAPVSELRASIAAQVTDAVVAAASGGKESLSIQMKPEFLGNLSIQLIMGREGLVAKIRTENPEVQGVIAAQINELAGVLRAKGVQVASMEVVYNQFSQLNDMPQSRNGQQTAKKNKTPVVERVEVGAPIADSWLDTSMIVGGTDGGSVEYSA